MSLETSAPVSAEPSSSATASTSVRTRRQPGRPSKLSPVRVAHILEYVAAGNSIRTSARASGLGGTTVFDWARKGDEELARVTALEPDISVDVADWLDQFSSIPEIWAAEPLPPFDPDKWLFSLFSVLLKKAGAHAEATALEAIFEAAKRGVWQASAWFLERRYPEEYGRVVRVTTKTETQATTPAAPMMPGDIMARIDQLRAKRNADQPAPRDKV